MSSDSIAITIRLEGSPTDDGHIRVTSPDLGGFRFILNHDDDPFEAMKPTLAEFIRLYLKSEIKKIRPSIGPRTYRISQYNLGLGHKVPSYLVAEIEKTGSPTEAAA